MEWKKK